MAKRGLYAKGVAKREEILDTALEVIAQQGYSSATVKELAAAVGLSQTGLLHYFGTKENLFTEVLRRRDVSGARTFAPQGNPVEKVPDFGALIAEIVQRNGEVPGLVQLSTSVTAEAIAVDHASHEYFRSRYSDITATFSRAAKAYQSDGLLDPRVDASKVGVLLMALIEGLQTQWLYNPELDMAAHIRYFWQLVQVGDARPAAATGSTAD